VASAVSAHVVLLYLVPERTWRDPDLNRGPLGYEPNELPSCSIPLGVGTGRPPVPTLLFQGLLVPLEVAYMSGHGTSLEVPDVRYASVPWIARDLNPHLGRLLLFPIELATHVLEGTPAANAGYPPPACPAMQYSRQRSDPRIKHGDVVLSLPSLPP
jgi:hypothetical protein